MTVCLNVKIHVVVSWISSCPPSHCCWKSRSSILVWSRGTFLQLYPKRCRVTIQTLSTTSPSLPSSSSCHELSGIALIHPTFIFLSLNCLSLSKYRRSVYQGVLNWMLNSICFQIILMKIESRLSLDASLLNYRYMIGVNFPLKKKSAVAKTCKHLWLEPLSLFPRVIPAFYKKSLH